ncbi:hypothetical protein C8R34_107112 [Nitrosomonas sp. Nm84]|uniref:hypothetical protein n=1 Tax=Nitrosomonas sp. Nm84 TaxID=200124 RepID=UPI000D76AC88|nr:hypothetical protein [Nitrosomonas sp. Nm84]PXW88429.1 hypothetical protein C8R34_107112 [Nitrosomonas sp. Nm84]
MRYFFLAALISIAATPVLASDLGISINIGQPGFYGQINLGNNYPRPQLIYPNPVLAIPPAVAIQQQPIYLYVPPGHAKKWSKHCHRYHACNQPVYFIQETWYNDVYMPHYRSQSNYSGDRYDSKGWHDGDDGSRNHSQRYSESRRDSHENHQGRRDDRDNQGRGNDKHRGKRGHGNDDRKEQDRGNRKD